mmetsp:Transcript_1874/g.7510  ORF Transcript_1874/g.7510 Transcript_1874/m.7510 type:complete len:242 (-) Transcript_1874:472-1197(-)
MAACPSVETAEKKTRSGAPLTTSSPCSGVVPTSTPKTTATTGGVIARLTNLAQSRANDRATIGARPCTGVGVPGSARVSLAVEPSCPAPSASKCTSSSCSISSSWMTKRTSALSVACDPPSERACANPTISRSMSLCLRVSARWRPPASLSPQSASPSPASRASGALMLLARCSFATVLALSLSSLMSSTGPTLHNKKENMLRYAPTYAVPAASSSASVRSDAPSSPPSPAPLGCSSSEPM